MLHCKSADSVGNTGLNKRAHPISSGVARNFKRGSRNFESHQKNLAYFSYLAIFVFFW